MLKNRENAMPRVFVLTFLKGGAVVSVLLWSILSFAPFVDLIYGELTTESLVINLLFGVTGAASLVPLYLLLQFLASPEGRKRFGASGDEALLNLGGFTAAWLLLYSFLA